MWYTHGMAPAADFVYLKEMFASVATMAINVHKHTDCVYSTKYH